jgi:hypothetical protein
MDLNGRGRGRRELLYFHTNYEVESNQEMEMNGIRGDAWKGMG